MLLRDEDSAVFKRWLLPKLETISDAEGEVLADYVIALVTGDETEDSIRRNCLECLADFLQENTTSFVDHILNALKTKSYVEQTQESRPAPIPSIVGTSNLEYELDPAVSANAPPSNAPHGPKAHRLAGWSTGPSPTQQTSPGLNSQQDRAYSSRKRKLVHRDTSETRDVQDSYYGRDSVVSRPSKHTTRRGGKALRGNASAFEPTNAFSGFPTMPNILNMANLPPPPPGPVPFEANDPMAFFAMMAALGSVIPGMPQLPAPFPQPNGTNGGLIRKEKCHDYHTKGFCASGNMCAFEHSDTAATLNHVSQHKGRQRRTKAHESGVKGGRPRASFSLPGPSFDRTNMTLVVEQIPEVEFSEDNIRGFFSQFGTIVEIQMQAYKSLAIIKFEDHTAASKAYNSPKAVFDNRFVKVYWYKQDSSPGDSGGYPYDDEMAEDAEEVLSPEEIAARQAEAQKAFEERRQKMAAAEARAAEIDRRLAETEAEMKVIKQQLAELTHDERSNSAEGNLIQDLAALQAEAETLFAQNQHQESVAHEPRYPPRGAYSSRGPFRGAYRGRGAFPTSFPGPRRSVNFKLDNRPRRLAVSDIEKGSARDEALRQYLVNVPECISIDPHPSNPTTLILTFQERYQAEIVSPIHSSIRLPKTTVLTPFFLLVSRRIAAYP
ncbi:hypothetical protein GQ44DRAFT_84725 [Phaeosphaeriaceae sp. PMI808]|nr:hypothetical protein GQ44DRAFT_84725 [Phaeosphaeriaceae sp. PMI808]